jgi:hypothetical protein
VPHVRRLARRVLRFFEPVVGAARAGVQYCRAPLPRGQYVALSTRPVVLLVYDFAINHPRASFLQRLARLVPWRPHVYYVTSWYVHPGDLNRHLANLRRIERACPGCTVTVIGQTAAETALFTMRGLDALFCNQNAFADERIYRPLPDIGKRFMAVYDAKLASYKRHALARQVSGLALMGYQDLGIMEAAYAAATLRDFGDVHWFNDPRRSPDQWQLRDADINTAYNQCRVGLCLSAVEGAMWTSIQYLLAGLPVVTTPSMGGRDEFFAAPYVRIVEPTPEAVADGVAQSARLELVPATIRRLTLERMQTHRERFFAHVQKRFLAAGEDRHFAAEWRGVIPHRLTDTTLVGNDRKAAIATHDRGILAAAVTHVHRRTPAPAPARSESP